MEKKILPKFIKPENITAITFHQDRAKSHGCMWGGEGEAVVNDHKLYLVLWYHGSDKETQESLMQHYTLKCVDGKDAYWHCLWDDESLWQHPIGWFGFSDAAKALESKIPKMNPNLYFRMLPEDELIAEGFVKLI